MNKLWEEKKISIIIPLYNHVRYIKDTILSLLKQTFTDFEIIIIDDGSTDNSGEVVKNINDSRIKYFYQENSGAHNAINRGIDLAGGEYIAILNSDDLYHPQRLEECLKILENDKSLSAVFTFIEFIDKDGNFIKIKDRVEDNWISSDFKTFREDKDNILFSLFIENFLVTTSNLFCRRNVFQKTGYFRDFRYAHDYDFFLRLSCHYKVHIINKTLLKYRRHDSNTISESIPAVEFENSLVLAQFFRESDFRGLIIGKSDKLRFMLDFFNSINTFKSGRLIIPFFISLVENTEEREELFKFLKDNPSNSFRRNFMEREKWIYENWLDTQKAWKRCDELERDLEHILNSPAYHVSSLLNDAMISRKMCLLFPFRLIWFCLPLKLKNAIKENSLYERIKNYLFPEKFSPED